LADERRDEAFWTFMKHAFTLFSAHAFMLSTTPLSQLLRRQRRGVRGWNADEDDGKVEDGVGDRIRCDVDKARGRRLKAVAGG